MLYIIKENRTYDEIFGDLPQGNGDPKLCSLGETVMPNHRKLAREFTLFDNGYVSGTNSADGHAWSTQCLANDYLEHFYVGYSRTYPDDGDCAMSISNGGALWDAALKKERTVRVWGEFCDDKLATYDPKPKDWFELWEDRKKGTHRFKFTADTTVASLKPLINREVHYWPLLQSDQFRADVFIREYEEFSRRDAVPDLMIMSLPCDHTEGTDPKYPDAARDDGRQRPGAGPGGRGGLEEPAVEGDVHLRRRGRRPVRPRPRRRPPHRLHGDQPVQPPRRRSTRRFTPRRT